jgi:FtsZ-binding cell division protein ZapB
MKSTKYQLLKDDFDHAVKEIGLLHKRIKELKEENQRLKKQSKVSPLEYDFDWAKDI